MDMQPASSDVAIDFTDFAKRIEGVAELGTSSVHGIRHWKAVTQTALLLADLIDEADVGVALLFGLLHDSQRTNENEDPDHGPFAADLMQQLRREGVITISDERADKLAEAMSLHDAGGVSDDPTIGVCWDADRLQLQRLGYPLDPERLSTPEAMDPQIQRIAAKFDHSPIDWNELKAMADAIIVRRHTAEHDGLSRPSASI